MEKDTPNVQQVHQYTSHNFESMNRAIDNEVNKQEMWTVLYDNHQREKGARSAFYIMSSLCVLAITGTLIWWLMFSGQVAQRILPSDIVTLDATNHTTGLKEISKIETVEGTEAPFINTTFTVFHRTLTPSGEEVVTGKTYEPANIQAPYEQYCYLESANRSGVLEAKPLAIFDSGEVILETKEAGLIQYAERYCRFSL